MESVFNNGSLTVTRDTISISKWFNSRSIERNRIVSITYQYDNLFYRVLRYPLGIIYLLTLIGIPIGIRCLRGDVMCQVRMSNREVNSFWIYGSDLREFKNVVR